MNQNRIVNVAFDCIQRVKTSGFPLKSTALEFVRQRKLNSRERKLFFDLVFLSARESNGVKKYLESSIELFNTMSEQAKEQAVISVMAAKIFGDAHVDGQAKELSEQYFRWINSEPGQGSLLKAGPYLRSQFIKDYGERAALVLSGLYRQPKKYLTYDRNRYQPEQIEEYLTANQIAWQKVDFLPQCYCVEAN